MKTGVSFYFFWIDFILIKNRCHIFLQRAERRILNRSDKQGLDITQIIEDKLRLNDEKYPVDKAKGSAKKYNEL